VKVTDKVACTATNPFASNFETSWLPEVVPILAPLLKNVIVPVGAAPELPPEERLLLLCVSTKAVSVTGVFVGTVVRLGVTEVVVGACDTNSVTGAVALLAL
jgi:hypothetical protein